MVEHFDFDFDLIYQNSPEYYIIEKSLSNNWCAVEKGNYCAIVHQINSTIVKVKYQDTTGESARKFKKVKHISLFSL